MPRPAGSKNKVQRTDTLVKVTMRVPPEVLDYFQQFTSYTSAMRRVLEKHVKDVGQSKEV